VLVHRSEAKALAADTTVGRAVAGARDGELKVFSISTMKCLRNLQAHSSDISGLLMMDQGSQILTTSWDGGCRLWNLETYDLIRQIADCKGEIRCMAVSPDHEHVFLGLHDGSIKGISIQGSGLTYRLKGL
jgi:WD40 repeat protein